MVVMMVWVLGLLMSLDCSECIGGMVLFSVSILVMVMFGVSTLVMVLLFGVSTLILFIQQCISNISNALAV